MLSVTITYMKMPLRIGAFTLIELMVSMTIITILTFIFFGQYPEAATRLSLINVSHTTSLLVREAQVRGSAIDSLNSALGGYGVYATLSSPDRIVLFGDTVDSSVPKPNGVAVGNGLFDNSPINETKTTSIFPTGYIVKKLCVGSGFPFTCNTNNTPNITSLTISFTRPDPEPHIYINNATSSSASAGCIELRAPLDTRSGHIRSVQVYNSGRITIVVGKCDNSSS